MNIDRENIAWVAGLYEGEGACGSFTRFGAKSPEFYLRIRMTDLGSLEQVKSIMEFGFINGPYRNKYAIRDNSTKNYKPYYVYSIASFEKVQAFLAMVFPRLSPKRKKEASDALNRGHKLTIG